MGETEDTVSEEASTQYFYVPTRDPAVQWHHEKAIILPGSQRTGQTVVSFMPSKTHGDDDYGQPWMEQYKEGILGNVVKLG